jgi:hypothetical protein
MNRMIFLLFLFPFLGCEKEIEYTDTQKVFFINTSPNRMLYFFEGTFGSDSLFSVGNDSNLFVHTDKKVVKRSILGTDRDRLFPAHIIFHEELYNFTDTTSYILSKNYNTPLSHKDSIYVKYVDDNTFREGIVNSTLEFRIIFNSNISKIMNKDYSMLQKFKHFYSK